MMNRFSLFLLINLVTGIATAQQIPTVNNYTSHDYGYSPQNWAITQDSSGFLYFGNSAGLLRYDGNSWKSLHIANNNIVSSLYTASTGKILVGGVGEFGYLQPDSLNQMNYKSLSVQLDSADQQFSYVWDITEYHGDYYFRTQEALFIQSEGKLSVLKAEFGIGNLEKVDDQLFVWLADKGLHLLKNKEFVFIEESEPFSDDVLHAIMPFDTNYLLSFRNAGLVIFDGQSFHSFDTPASDYIKQFGVYKAKIINDGQFALATLNGGILIADMKGRITYILNEEKGLNSNAVYELYLDEEETLWAALEEGISRISVNNPVKEFDKSNGISGAVLSIAKVKEQLYICTTEGLFVRINQDIFEKISLPVQRVFDIMVADDNLLLATDQGIYQVEENKFKSAAHNLSLDKLISDKKLANTFWGISGERVYQVGIQKDAHALKEISNTGYRLHSIFEMNDTIWLLTQSQEILKLDKQGQILQKFWIKMGKGDHIHFLGNLNNSLSAGTSKGLYTYRPMLDSFVKDSTYQDDDLLNKQVFSFQQCSSDEIWFRADRQIKRAVLEDQKWNIHESPYQLIGEEEAIHDIFCDERAVWFGGNSELYHLANTDWKYQNDFKTNITALMAEDDSLLYGGFGDPDRYLELPYTNKELRFTYAASSFIAPDKNSYRVRLRGYDDSWSNWTTETEKDYTFIPNGIYTFEVQGRNIYQKAGTIDSFTFTILPPWYRTFWAYLLYLMVITGILYVFHRIRINRILREQEIRNRIASDLHDEVSATLSSITYFAEAIRQVNNGDREKRFVELIYESASEAKEKITDIIWSIDPDNDDWINLLSKCRRFASDLLESKNIDYQLDIDTDIDRPLELILRQHLWLIFKEMIINAARHSDAGKIDVKLGMQGNKLRLVIQDNGVGMEESAVKNEGNGIKNIKKRAQQIGAELQLKTNRDIGTQWIMELKIS